MTNHQAARLLRSTLAQLSQAVLQYRSLIDEEYDKKEYELPAEESAGTIEFNNGLRNMVQQFHGLMEKSK